jgi:cation transport regulator ChaC
MSGRVVDPQYVFGYGSLLELRDRREARASAATTFLTGYTRLWNVAMDNSVDLPGYKYYVDPRSGARPSVFVTFLNIEPAPGGRVNGTLLKVTPADLVELDARERNYARIDLTAAVMGDVDGTVWSYVGTPAGRARFAAGLTEARAVIQQQYHDHVHRQFATIDGDGLVEFERLTMPPPCRLVDLRRIDL